MNTNVVALKAKKKKSLHRTDYFAAVATSPQAGLPNINHKPSTVTSAKYEK